MPIPRLRWPWASGSGRLARPSRPGRWCSALVPSGTEVQHLGLTLQPSALCVILHSLQEPMIPVIGSCALTCTDFAPMTAAHALPCIAIAGPTASGKTAAALALAERLAQRGQKAEIISVDSALVYKGMDIGTAKPTAAEQAAVPHHLIDIIDPLQAYSAAEFVRDTQ